MALMIRSRFRPCSNPLQVLPRSWFLVSLVLLMGESHYLPAAVLSDPAVDTYNVHVGTQTFAGLYQFTTNTLLVETAEAIHGLGSDVIKGYLGSDFPKQYHLGLPANITNLLTLARDEPSCHRVFDMSFRHFVFWAYPFGNGWPFDGYSATERTDDYREIYDLTRYFLTNYNNSGKTFYLGHWEGDWYLLPNYDTSTNPSPVAIQGMIDWLNNRQKAIDDARSATPHSNVEVFGYAEVNRVLDATSGNPNINQRMINKVIPYVTNLDCLSYSSYDVAGASASTLYSTLNYMQSQLPANKAASVPGPRIWIGEYGWGGESPAAQEPLNRSYIQRLLTWGPRFILFWEMYNNETNRNFCLIDPNNIKVPSYYLHQRFLNNARLFTARFKETNGRLPSDAEFAALLTPTLDQPLPAPASLAVSNRTAALQDATSAVVSGSLAQGIYGQDGATVSVFYGRQDGGANRSRWEHSQQLGTNTKFNPSVRSAQLTGLEPQTNYFFRFYATNSAGESWAPASAQFSTATVDPADYGSRLKIAFTGYNRNETLLGLPVLVRLNPNLPGFSYRQFASPTGGDLRFTDAGGLMLIPHEIDEWNTNGTSTVWVRVPQVTGTNDFIWAYWGDPLAKETPAVSTNGAVWLPEHDLVWHLKENGFPYSDSARQHAGAAGVAPASTSGMIGRGITLNGVSQYVDAGLINLGDAFTLSAWVNLDPAATNIQTIWANKAGGWNADGFALYVNSYNTSDHRVLLETGNGTSGATASTVPNVVTPGQWHRITAVVDESVGAAQLYVDGTDYTRTGAIRTDFNNAAAVNLGRFASGVLYFKGAIDEARIEARTRSANWVWANWLTTAGNATLANYSSITRSRPALSAATMMGGLLLSWPASGIGFSLYTATNLASPVIWSLASNQPVWMSNEWQILLSPPPAAYGGQFFRLQSP